MAVAASDIDLRRPQSAWRRGARLAHPRPRRQFQTSHSRQRDDHAQQPSDAADTPDADRKLFRKAAWRLMPFLFVCYLFAQDRMNIAFAKLDMLDDLAFGSRLRLLGAGVFFIGVLFEVPSNMLLCVLRRAPLAGAHHGVLGLVSAGMMFANANAVLHHALPAGHGRGGFFPASSTSLAGSRASTAAG